jgi:hypothetical protein
LSAFIQSGRFGAAGAVGHRYWRVPISAITTGTGTYELDEIELYESLDGDNIAPLATITTNRSVSGGLIGALADGQASGAVPYNIDSAYKGIAANINDGTMNVDFDFGPSFSPAINLHKMVSGTTLSGYGGGFPSAWKLQHGDGGAYTDVFSTTGETWGESELKTKFNTGYAPSYTGSPHGTFDIIRVLLLGGGGGFAYYVIEAEFRATPGGADQCSGGTPLAYAEYFSGGFPIAGAFANDGGSTYWVGRVFPSGNTDFPGWFQYSFAAPVAMAEFSYSGNANSAKAIIVQGKRTGGQWCSLFSGQHASWGSETVVFTDPLYV